MNNKKVRLKSVADLEIEKIKFYVDSYQRGYRWTEDEVSDLLEDISEFSQKYYANNDVFYCLQPIIVTHTPEDDTWKVIDGQQRLTTLYLIAIYFKGVFPNVNIIDPYSISYKNKERLTSCIKEVSEFANTCEWNDEIKADLNSRYGDDIDCYYIIRAFGYICDKLNEERKDPVKIQSLINLNATFTNKTKIIWYDLQATSLKDETSSFRKINMGKIALTNAELIKALLLRNDKSDSDELSNYKKNIAVFWNNIEQELSDDRFWHFLTNAKREDYPNRIDFVFDVISQNINNEWETNDLTEDDKYIVKRSSNQNYFSFHVFSRYIDLLDSDDYVQTIWREVEEYFRMFKDWYSENKWYHLIGYYICISGNKYLDAVCDISKLYRNHTEGKKSAFVKSLTDLVNSSVRRIGKKTVPFKSTGDLKNYLNDEFIYPKNSKDIEKILLLYNIASTESIKNEYTRFPFYAYKNSEIHWSIEHINPQKEDKPKNETDRKEWLEKLSESVDEITVLQGDSDNKRKNIEALKNNIKEAHKKIINNETVDADVFSTLYDNVIDILDEDQGTDHTIRNLVLLDSGTNSCFSNSIFPVKRRLLIDAYKSSDVFIPICTRNVFFKAFPESKELLKWSQNDKNEYFESIVRTISHYLDLKETSDDGQ